MAYSGCSSLHVVPEELVEIPIYQPQKEIDVVLVLGGGGVKGLAHLGAIQELEKMGIRPDLIIGCSAGAIAGAIYADQLDIENSVGKLLEMRRGDIFDYAYMNPILGIVHGNLLQSQIGRLLQAKTFEELKIPLIVVSTDLSTGETLEFSSGPLSLAIRASCAFPGMFKPVPLYGRYCIDGGASAPIPIHIAKRYGAKLIIAIDVSEKLSKGPPKHLFGVTKRSLEIAYRNFVQLSLAQADIVLAMDFEPIGSFSDDKNEWIFEQGKCRAREHSVQIQEKFKKCKVL